MIGFNLDSGHWSGILSDCGRAEGDGGLEIHSLYVLTMKMNATPEYLMRASSEQSSSLSTRDVFFSLLRVR